MLRKLVYAITLSYDIPINFIFDIAIDLPGRKVPIDVGNNWYWKKEKSKLRMDLKWRDMRPFCNLKKKCISIWNSENCNRMWFRRRPFCAKQLHIYLKWWDMRSKVSFGYIGYPQCLPFRANAPVPVLYITLSCALNLGAAKSTACRSTSL